jgi:hypothetical protein
LLVTFAYRVVPVTVLILWCQYLVLLLASLPLSYDICLPLLFLLLMLR